VVGSWSDRLRTPLGSRLPFILAATPALVVALAVLGFVQSIAQAAIVVAAGATCRPSWSPTRSGSWRCRR
jgi:Na+/melibiose symporter-like transporter